MSLSLQAFELSIDCDGKELEMYDVKQEGPNSMRAFVASEAGKQFEIAVKNKLLDFDLGFSLRLDGERINSYAVDAGKRCIVSGIDASATSILPFMFQELELVDPDLEDAPILPEMGTIELRAYRCHILSEEEYEHIDTPRLHGGRASEHSKQSGWHRVSTADEIPNDEKPLTAVEIDTHDPPDAPCATFKVFYRPRELLMAQGVIIGHSVDAGISGGSEANDKKRVRDDDRSPGPSKRRTGPTVKSEEDSADTRAQRIQALQAELSSLSAKLNSSVAELNSLMAEQSSSSVKRELRSPSPIVVGRAAGKVVDLSLED